MVRYKAAELGIKVILTEEAYTSKASFLDGDPLPKYEEGVIRTFSGRADSPWLVSKSGQRLDPC